jgi:hypothetical protein
MDWSKNANALMGNVVQGFDCQTCGKDFSSMRGLQTHERMHLPKVPKVSDDWAIDFINLNFAGQQELLMLLDPRLQIAVYDARELHKVMWKLLGEGAFSHTTMVQFKLELARLTGKNTYRYMIAEEP